MKTINHPRTLLRTTGLALVSAVVLASGCDQAATEDDELLAELPEVREAVVLDELCALATELRCAGSMRCCAEAPHASMDACLAASSCEDTLASITGSDLFAEGVIAYDADAAATMLRDLADSTAECGVESPAPDLGALFVGQRAQGEDCTPRDGSGAHLLSCAPGLSCIVHEDHEGGALTGRCEREEAFTAGEGEASGVPLEPSAEALYCAAPPDPDEELEFRAAITPTALSVNTRNVDYGGTSADVTLHFIQSGSTAEYYCTISGGITKNTTKICKNPQVRYWGSASNQNAFYVENQSNDGLAVDSVAVCLADDGSQCTSTSSSYKGGTFDNGNTSMLRKVIVWAFGAFDDGYEWFWVDGDSAGNCNVAKINLSDDNTVSCLNSHAH